MADIRIYQGNQIGGCVTVISAEAAGLTHRIMIDYGLSLPGSDLTEDFEYPWEDEPVDAVFFTHYHGDHVGRLMDIPENIPFYIGETAREVMINIYEALSVIRGEEGERHKKKLAILKDDKRIHTFHYNGHFYDHIKDIPGFKVEPYSVDHSAYDAYMFLIEAADDSEPSGKKVILHTGDFRGHGRRGKAMIPVIRYYVHKGSRQVNTLITEGTMMGRMDEEIRTETQMMFEAAEYLKEHKYAFLICSSTNLDSLASFYQAAQIAASPYSRYLYTYNDYYRTQLETFSKTAGGFTDVYQFANVYKLDKYLRPFIEDYKAGKIDQMPVIIYSMWEGYLQEYLEGDDGEKKENKAKHQTWIDFLKKQEINRNIFGLEIRRYTNEQSN